MLIRHHTHHYICIYIRLANPVGSGRHLSGWEEPGMSPRPSPNEYVAMTIHLTEQEDDSHE